MPGWECWHSRLILHRVSYRSMQGSIYHWAWWWMYRQKIGSFHDWRQERFVYILVLRSLIYKCYQQNSTEGKGHQHQLRNEKATAVNRRLHPRLEIVSYPGFGPWNNLIFWQAVFTRGRSLHGCFLTLEQIVGRSSRYIRGFGFLSFQKKNSSLRHLL